MTEQPEPPLTKMTPRPVVRTLSLKTTLVQFALLALMLIGAWWFHRQLTDQSQVTDAVNRKADELGDQIAEAEAATGQISENVNRSLTDVSQRLKSVETELSTARKNLDLVEQRATDVAATLAVSNANAGRVKFRADQITQRLGEFTTSLQTWSSLIEETRNRSGRSAEEFTPEELAFLDGLFSLWHDERSRQQVDHWRARLTTLMTPVNELLVSDSHGRLIPADTVNAIDELAREIEDEQQRLTDSLNSLQAFTRKFDAPYPPEVGSLQDMVLRNRLAIAKERNARTIAGITDRRNELDGELEQAIPDRRLTQLSRCHSIVC